MIQPKHSRRADHGTLIVRASMVAAGIAAAMGLQLSEPSDPGGTVIRTAGNALSAMCSDANGSFALL
jgi:hypothetical protein